MRPRALPRALAVVVLSLGLAAPFSPALADPASPPGSQGQGADSRSERAEDVLEYAEALVAEKSPEDAVDQITGQEIGGLGGGTDNQVGLVTSVPDPTMALRDLYFARENLKSTELQRANRILARPASNRVTCVDGPAICVHYSNSGSNKATWTWVKETRSVVQKAYRTYLAAGYRRPARDGNRYVDVYLTDLGSQGLYGYAQTVNGGNGGTSAAAILVLDNDYRPGQFPQNTPKQNLRVTAAHEFFHAVQFAYDAVEDNWLMEGTATWAEEEVFPWINDNRQYLPYGQLGIPSKPLDAPGAPAFYGNWLFFQHLGQRFPHSQGGMPTIVRDIWRRADSTRGEANDSHSVQAVDQVITARGKDFDRIYALFAASNQHPRKAYADGATYTSAPRTNVKVWRTSTSRAGSWSGQHLTSKAVRFIPRNTTAGRKATVSISVPAGSQTYGFVTVYQRNGGIKKVQLSPGPGGKASATVPFATANVVGAELVMANSGRKYRCWDGIYSCSGKPLSNGVPFSWNVRFTG